MGEASPYRTAEDKTTGLSEEERGRIIAEMIAARAGRAEEREEQRRKLLRPAVVVASVVFGGTVVALVLGNDMRSSLSVVVGFVSIAALAAWNRSRLRSR